MGSLVNIRVLAAETRSISGLKAKIFANTSHSRNTACGLEAIFKHIMDPATIDGVTFVLPDMSWAELQDTSPAIFVPRLRRENMRLSLGWFAINMTRVYKHMVKALQPETGSNRERKRTKKAMLKRVSSLQHV